MPRTSSSSSATTGRHFSPARLHRTGQDRPLISLRVRTQDEDKVVTCCLQRLPVALASKVALPACSPESADRDRRSRDVLAFRRRATESLPEGWTVEEAQTKQQITSLDRHQSVHDARRSMQINAIQRSPGQVGAGISGFRSPRRDALACLRYGRSVSGQARRNERVWRCLQEPRLSSWWRSRMCSYPGFCRCGRGSASQCWMISEAPRRDACILQPTGSSKQQSA